MEKTERALKFSSCFMLYWEVPGNKKGINLLVYYFSFEKICIIISIVTKNFFETCRGFLALPNYIMPAF